MISGSRLAQVSSSESLTVGCSFVGLGVILPIVMCSIIRRRNGITACSVMGMLVV